MLNKPSVIIANKMDAEGASENLKEFKKKYPNELVIPISAATNQGLDKLMITLMILLKMFLRKKKVLKKHLNHILMKKKNLLR